QLCLIHVGEFHDNPLEHACRQHPPHPQRYARILADHVSHFWVRHLKNSSNQICDLSRISSALRALIDPALPPRQSDRIGRLRIGHLRGELRIPRPDVSLKRTRFNDRHFDPQRSHLQAQSLCPPLQSELRCNIAADSGKPGPPGDRAHHHHVSESLPPHLRQNRPSQRRRAEEVHLKLIAELRIRDFFGNF